MEQEESKVCKVAKISTILYIVDLKWQKVYTLALTKRLKLISLKYSHEKCVYARSLTAGPQCRRSIWLRVLGVRVVVDYTDTRISNFAVERFS